MAFCSDGGAAEGLTRVVALHLEGGQRGSPPTDVDLQVYGVGRFVARIVAPAALIAATVFLGITGPGTYETLRIVCTVFVALPGGLKLGSDVADRIGIRRGSVARTVRDILRNKVLRISRDPRFHDVDTTRISMHVWEMPPWFRAALPFNMRRRIAEYLSDDMVRKLGRWLPLRPLAIYRTDPQPPSGVRFRKGKGLVGICVEENKKGKAQFIDFESSAFKSAIATEVAWDGALGDITRSLGYKDARTLASRYGQAVALVIQDESGEAIGTLTMSMPIGCPVRIEDDALGDLILALGETADIVCSVLTGRKGAGSLT